MSSSVKKSLTNQQQMIVGIALSVLSGLFLFLSFPPLNLWPLVFVCAVPYMIAQYRIMPPRWSRIAPTIAWALWLWPFLYIIFNVEGAPFVIQHMGLLVAVFTFLTSTDRKFHELTKYRWFVLQGTVGWVGIEMIRSFIPMLGTMGFIANPLAGQPWLIQPISIFSIYGLSLLVVVCNFALTQMLMHWVDGKFDLQETVPVDGRASRRWLAGSAVSIAIWVAVSLVILNQQPENPQVVRVAALHMDLKDPGHLVEEAVTEAKFEELRSMARQAADEGAQVLFVPEMAFGINPAESYTAELQALAAETNTYLYFSYAHFTNDNWYNETVLISPSGEFSPIYGKLHPAGEPPIASAGTFPVNETQFGTLGSVICMDGVYTDATRTLARSGVQLLGIPSFNTTVGISKQNWTHFVMRAAENQVPVVNADRGFYSMVTDSHGRILADMRTPEGGSGVVIADVTLGGGGTLYQSLGDWVGWIALAGMAFFMVYQSRVEKQAKAEE